MPGTGSPQPRQEGQAGARAGRRRRRLLTSGELAERSGLSRQVIYTYTTMGLLREAERSKAGHKLFEETALVRLRIIENLKERGYTLRDIKQIFFARR
ncbi:MAG: hypothetical protein KatS3mg102_2577 [Planctomycetota bacterium]|nr:MAG: hypothetical protein KatS3mg102_2577 [Planctomycetota bacterium]